MTEEEKKKEVAQPGRKYTEELHSDQSPPCFGSPGRPSLPSCFCQAASGKAAFDNNCQPENVSSNPCFWQLRKEIGVGLVFAF